MAHAGSRFVSHIQCLPLWRIETSRADPEAHPFQRILTIFVLVHSIGDVSPSFTVANKAVRSTEQNTLYSEKKKRKEKPRFLCYDCLPPNRIGSRSPWHMGAKEKAYTNAQPLPLHILTSLTFACLMVSSDWQPDQGVTEQTNGN